VAVTVAVSTAAAIGTLSGTRVLTTFYPKSPSMVITTAATFAIAAISLWILTRNSGIRGIRISQLCAAFVIVVGIIALIDYVFGWKLDAVRYGWMIFGRPAPYTAVVFVLFGSALLTFDVKIGRGCWPSEVLGLAAGLAGLLAVSGHVLGVTPFYTVANLAVSMPAALSTVALSAGFFASRDHHGLMLLLASQGPDGIVSRRLLPLPFLLPIALGFLRVGGQRLGWWPSAISVWLFSLLNIVVLTCLVWWTAALLRDADYRRQRADRRLRRTNDRLEERVAERTAALKTSEEKYRLLAELIPQIVWTAGPDGIFDYYNERWYEYTGLSPEQSWGSDWQAVVHPEDLQRYVDAWAAALRGGQSYQIAYRLKQASDGKYRWHLGRGLPMRDGAGNIVKWFSTATDIHDQKLLEEQLRQAQKLEGIGRLAGGVAHDFNNLLTVIGGYTQLLLADCDAARRVEEHERLQEVSKASERASALTKQLLAFSRRQVLQPRVLDLNALITNLENMLRRLIGEDIELISILSADLGRVKADSGQLEQVITNLVVNARDAMPNGGTITISTTRAELDTRHTRDRLDLRPDAYIMLAISDTGEGMDAETKARMFEPFFTTKGEGKGTGLGLSTAYGIVKQSGGDIEVDSERDGGTTFRIYLPESLVGTNVEIAADPPPPTRGSGTILVVEDEEAVRKLATIVLQQHGYTVLTANNASEALDACDQHARRIDLVISDIVMPGMNGFELKKRIRMKQPYTRLLFMSGYTEHAVLQANAFESVDAFISKPFTAQQLAGKVQELLRGGAAESSIAASTASS
jgi:PAS domain S-box-containing protein